MTEYMIDNGPGAGVQGKKEGAIMEDDQPADLDSILDRIAPGKREAFLKSRARLMDKGDAELLPIVLPPRSENARDIDTARKEVQALTEAVRSAGDGLNALTARCKVLDDAVAVFHGVARSRLWWLIGLAFLSGAAVGWATFFVKL